MVWLSFGIAAFLGVVVIVVVVIVVFLVILNGKQLNVGRRCVGNVAGCGRETLFFGQDRFDGWMILLLLLLMMMMTAAVVVLVVVVVADTRKRELLARQLNPILEFLVRRLEQKDWIDDMFDQTKGLFGKRERE